MNGKIMFIFDPQLIKIDKDAPKWLIVLLFIVCLIAVIVCVGCALMMLGLIKF